MVLGTVAPGVVRDFVIVPHRDPRVLAVRLLQIGIALVLRVALAIVGNRDDLAVRIRVATQLGPVAIDGVGVLVQIVAEMQHRIEIGAPGDPIVDVEIAVGKIRAGDDGQA
jgi:hypothetical protein